MMQTKLIEFIAAGTGFSAFVHLGVYAYNKYLQKFAPAIENIDVRSQEADKRFRKLDLLFTPLIIGLVVVYMLPAYYASKLVAEWSRSRLPPADLNVFPTDSFYILVALFVGIGMMTATF